MTLFTSELYKCQVKGDHKRPFSERMPVTILPSNDAYVNIFPQLRAHRQHEGLDLSKQGKSILSGKVFEPAEPMRTSNNSFNEYGCFARSGRK